LLKNFADWVKKSDLWKSFSRKPEYRRKKQTDQASYSLVESN